MAHKWIEILTGPLEQKHQYRQAKSRIEALPEPYGKAAKALNRYLMYYSGITDGEALVDMFVDHADLWERAALDGTPISEIVGEDPVEFAETFAQAFRRTHWIDKERTRLRGSIADAKHKEER